MGRERIHQTVSLNSPEKSPGRPALSSTDLVVVDILTSSGGGAVGIARGARMEEDGVEGA